MRSRPPVLFAFLASFAGAQTPSPQIIPSTAPPQNAAEVASQDASLTFQSKVNLVLVPVVVRDKTGKPVGSLTKDDFQLFDKGKLQIISRFSVEKADTRRIPVAPQAEKSPAETAADAAAPGMVVPDHFVAWFFDDIHLSFPDLAQARQAAEQYLLTNLNETTRMAIYTTSGQTVIDFTDNFQQLRDGLAQLRPRPIARPLAQECPDVSYYMADLIVNRNDAAALNTAAQDAYACLNMSPPQTIKDAQPIAQSAAYRVLSAGEQETRVSLGTLKDLVRRMGAMPGQRVVVMISPGFLRLNDQLQDESDIIDRAIKANVTISALDARGLYTDTPDISKRSVSSTLVAKQQYDREAARADADVMAELAAATGGTFFENNNDLSRGMTDLSTVPEVYYVLAFSPQNLKLDGSYHNLKIALRTPAGLSIKARRGYYAPRHLSDADEEAKEEISQALFSRDEMRDIPVDMHTQFFKAGADEA
ncbi:MAG TPA: VWA domain-containing protein, partial [Chthoniobacterales bacterium]